jgi:hypothetical protein
VFGICNDCIGKKSESRVGKRLAQRKMFGDGDSLDEFVWYDWRRHRDEGSVGGEF